MKNFRPVDRDTGFLMPPSVDEWLPERHLARFVVDVVGGLDLRAMIGSYRRSGEASYHPAVLLGILVYGYATGVFSSRKLERATYDSVAFRFVAANQHPDHDTIAAFRRRFLDEICATVRPSPRYPKPSGSCKASSSGRARRCPADAGLVRWAPCWRYRSEPRCFVVARSRRHRGVVQRRHRRRPPGHTCRQP
jgi:transposase